MYEISKNDGKSPLNIQTAYRNENELTTKLNPSCRQTTEACHDDVSIKFISTNKILITWKEEKMVEKAYLRTGPTYGTAK